MTPSLLLIVSIGPCCPPASLIVMCQACCLLHRACQGDGEVLSCDGKSGGSVKLIVNGRANCRTRHLLSTWWRLWRSTRLDKVRQGPLDHVTLVWSFGVIHYTAKPVMTQPNQQHSDAQTACLMYRRARCVTVLPHCALKAAHIHNVQFRIGRHAQCAV